MFRIAATACGAWLMAAGVAAADVPAALPAVLLPLLGTEVESHDAKQIDIMPMTTSSPWSAVGFVDNGCTGTLIDAQHVLAAAHCFTFDYDGQTPAGAPYLHGAWQTGLVFFPNSHPDRAHPPPIAIDRVIVGSRVQEAPGRTRRRRLGHRPSRHAGRPAGASRADRAMAISQAGSLRVTSAIRHSFRKGRRRSRSRSRKISAPISSRLLVDAGIAGSNCLLLGESDAPDARPIAAAKASAATRARRSSGMPAERKPPPSGWPPCTAGAASTGAPAGSCMRRASRPASRSRPTTTAPRARKCSPPTAIAIVS